MKTTTSEVEILKIEDRLGLNKFDVDDRPHITVNFDICKGCSHKACTFVCPAVLYTYDDESNQIRFSYEGCLECGTCRVACDRGAITWDHPRGGFGILFRYG